MTQRYQAGIRLGVLPLPILNHPELTNQEPDRSTPSEQEAPGRRRCRPGARFVRRDYCLTYAFTNAG
ncbi:hypothetical protein SAMN05444858_10146 [Micromonospora avicenniae]|uniref:Uncharacterized protein n=1 Tax=Micromonospora avicenniae TaxID=1198245 RepID=A0A1N6PVN3_9ACTN|nr:hypothetical protein SAMN05444858_10146 [Micromonospora avicenniae]